MCLSPGPLCLQESDYQTVEYLHKLENHKYVDPIESWFQTIVNTPHSFIVQQLLVPYQLKKLISHAFLCPEVYSLKLSMSIISILLRTWLHWKYSYT